MITEKISAIKKVLEDAEKQTNTFGKKNGISCPAGCGKCCITPNIEASPLEFLPAAYELHKQGLSEQTLEKLKTSEPKSICIFYDDRPDVTARCTMYNNRGLVCRLFGYSARVSKTGDRAMITCRIIKESEPYTKVGQQQLRLAPLAADFYMQLRGIDLRDGDIMLPVNQAIESAIKSVLHHTSYIDE